jgi:hypothetical protein
MLKVVEKREEREAGAADRVPFRPAAPLEI